MDASSLLPAVPGEQAAITPLKDHNHRRRI
jgi:hypothetical protein